MFNNVFNLALFMISEIGKDKNNLLTENGTDWDAVAAIVWNKYTGVFNEFIINDAIDYLIEAAETA